MQSDFKTIFVLQSLRSGELFFGETILSGETMFLLKENYCFISCTALKLSVGMFLGSNFKKCFTIW